MSVSLATPMALVLLALVAAVAWSLRHEAAGRRAAQAALGTARLVRRPGALTDADRGRLGWLRAAAIGLAVLAVARPQAGTLPGEASRRGRDLLLALDVSRSMLVTDADGPRLARAKVVTERLLAQLPGDRVGLVVFGGGAFLQLPLTTDHAVLRQFLAAASPADVADPSTDVAAALTVAATTFAHEGEDGHRAVVLLSDGERSEGPLDPALARLSAARVPVFVVGVGTEAGGLVPADATEPADSGSAWHLDNIGRPVQSRLSEADLRRVADGTGGAYARWDDDAALRRLVTGIRAVATRTLRVRRATEAHELFQWPLAAAVGLLLLELGVPWRRRRAAVAAGGALLVAGCVGAVGDLRRGDEHYRAGRFDAALAAFRAASGRDSTRADAHYNAGNALFRLRRYADAAGSFERAAALAAPPLRKLALFNRGAALARAAEADPGRADLWPQAVAAYEELLRLDPTDRDAKWNLEVALRQRDANAGSGGGPNRGGRAEAGRGDMDSEGAEGRREQAVGAMAGGGSGDAAGESVEELDAEQARRLLEAVERQQLESHQGRRTRGSRPGGRDW